MWNPCGGACVPEHRCVTGEWKNNKQVNSWLGCTICKKCELTHLSDCGLKIHCLGKIAVFPSKLYSVLAEHSCEVCVSLNICYFFLYTWLGWLTPAKILQPSRSLMSSYASVEVYWNLWFGGEERFSVVWPVRGCAGCWVGNGFCHLTPKQEYTILRESFPNKGSYNFVQSKAAHLYPKPPPLWDAPDSRRDDDDVTQCFNFLHKHSAYQMCNN